MKVNVTFHYSNCPILEKEIYHHPTNKTLRLFLIQSTTLYPEEKMLSFVCFCFSFDKAISLALSFIYMERFSLWNGFKNASRSLKLLDLLHGALKRADRYRSFNTYLRLGELEMPFFSMTEKVCLIWCSLLTYLENW